jgi:pyridoxamine 5'-phosphate oxidase
VASEGFALREEDVAANPFDQLATWYREAQGANVAEPDALAVATATPDGLPSVRMVLLRGVDERGLVFYTNYESQKGRELAQNPRAAALLYWPELHRQVRVTGPVARVTREESERYFHGRPVGSQLAALASAQSTVIPSRAALDRRYAELAAEYAGKDVPLPPTWGGFRLAPESFEFWQSRPNRLHDRLRYRIGPDRTWTIERLAP